MDKTEGGTEQPLQTVADALGAQNNDVFERFAESLVGKSPEKAAEQPEQVKADEAQPETEVAADNTADLSQTPEAKADEDDHSDDGLNADQKARIQKRIDKEVAKRKAAEEKAAQSEAIRAELEALKASQAELQKKLAEKPESAQPEPEVDGIDPRLLTVPEIKKIWDAEKRAETAYETTKTMLRALKRDPDSVIKELSKLGIKAETDEDAKDALSELRERAFRKQLELQGHRERTTERFWQNLQASRQAQAQEARKHYTWLEKLNDKSASGPEVETAKKVLERFPTLLEYADGEKLLGHLVAGELNFAKPKAEAAKPAPVIPPKPPATPKAPVRSNGSVGREEIYKRAEASGGMVEDLAALMPV